MKDRLICAGRSAYYATIEPLRLWWERQKHDDGEWHKRTKVSVYIPTHNRAELLVERALKSVFAQTHQPFEVIVAAHGCTDRTAEMALSAWKTSKLSAWITSNSKPKSSFKILQVPRTQTYPPTAVNHWLAGPVVPANAALAECRGDFIARIDDDDLWTPDHIETLLRFAQSGNYEFVSAAHATSLEKVRPYELDGIRVGGVQTWLYRNYLGFMHFNQDCWRKRFDRVNDTDLQRRFVNAGVRMGYLDKITAMVYPRPGEGKVGLAAYLEDAENKERQFAFTA